VFAHSLKLKRGWDRSGVRRPLTAELVELRVSERVAVERATQATADAAGLRKRLDVAEQWTDEGRIRADRGGERAEQADKRRR